MNIIVNGFTYKLVKLEEAADYVEYGVYRSDNLIGYITKCGAEVHYTARGTNKDIKATGATLRATLENMVLNMFYSHSYTGERRIKTLGEWLEGAELSVEYVKNDYVKHAKRVVKYSKSAGDLYIVLDNKKYFYYEFN